jgi:hypothetical protein
MNDATITGRIQLLEEFLSLARAYQTARRQGTGAADTKSKINRTLLAVRQAVIDTGHTTALFVAPPPAVGGYAGTLDVFQSFFVGPRWADIQNEAVNVAEQAIGFYESLAKGLVQPPQHQTLDVEASIDRALRPAFRDPPTSERPVQDMIATILRGKAIDFHREKESAPVGPTEFVPDFTIPSLGMAIEVKFAHAKHGAADVQREIAEDVAGYGTKWGSQILFVVYDCGAISDPEQFRRENQKHFGVRVLIVKH